MNFFVSRTLCFPALSLSLALSGCAGFLGVEIPVPAWEQDDDDAVADDDDDAGSLFVTLSGNVIATARMTGEPLSDWAYLNCAGKTVLYVFLDPNDLRSPAAKFTMDTPGQWDLTVDVNSGPYHVIGLTDNGNRIIGNEDVRRAYPFNPVSAEADRTGIELVMDLPCRSDGSNDGTGDNGGGWGANNGGGGGGGGGGGDDDDQPNNVTIISGQVTLTDLSNNEIMITANNADGTVGPIEWQIMPGVGAFSIEIANNRAAAALLAYHDTDGNGLFEVSDSLGEPSGNPYVLGVGDIPGVTIEIPSGSGNIPQPPVYVGVQGTVAMSNFPGGTIRMFASAGSPAGMAFSTAVLSTPGNFALSAPIDAGVVTVWGVLDEESDGLWDVSLDPFDSFGPVNVPPSGLAGITLDLGQGVNTVSGSVSLGGITPGPLDVVYVGLFSSGAYEGDPTYLSRTGPPTMNFNYSITDIANGTWYASAMYDIDGDSMGGPDPNDLVVRFGAVTFQGGDQVTGVDFNIDF
jgi:hypothetical protein